ncbi:deoxyribodipyrimidine photo-lyase [Aliagarivorans marinus]|uniref:deoxyribodipyrimidine photo-lyase n=1 Tax=Aliagarivorans marinus TaxID=561965 RepID=UPI000400488E|nr:deoxyribodipyrimidine photo-lyase [Aliagarivorans marinus]
MKHGTVWFRKDLRVTDNPALYQALQHADRVSAVYVDCQELRSPSNNQQRFIQESINQLAYSLAVRGIPFSVLTCETKQRLPEVMEQHAQLNMISGYFANYAIDIESRRSDHDVEQHLSVPLQLFNGDCVLPHGSIRTANGSMYHVYTPFSRAWVQQLRLCGYSCFPAPEACDEQQASAPPFPGVAEQIDWPAGEVAAQQRLKRFCIEYLEDYERARDFPSVSATSQLSPYLAVGSLSPNQCLQALKQHLGQLPTERSQPGFAWLNELIWREFYRHLLYEYPRLGARQAFKPDTEKVRWKQNPQGLSAWQEGMTGYPIVDAAMRCLKRSGWMHNRLRMIVASFLTKDLHIDWRVGESWFSQLLIDYDLAANNGGWQWAASTGADAAPYFRVFNPTTQGQRFDPEGAFIKAWVEELAEVPAKHIHQPHEWLAAQQPDTPYPQPIVDHKQARLDAIAMFKQASTEATT